MIDIDRIDLTRVRSDFPILERETSHGIRLVYLDSAATSQRPQSVIAAVTAFYEAQNANIHRGIHTLAEEATASYEHARELIAEFIHAGSPREIVFTRNTTESINLVAYSWGRKYLSEGDHVLLTEMEHHSNLVPWYMLADELGVTLDYVHVNEHGMLDEEDYQKQLSHKPALVAFTHMSNVLGTINPVVEMTRQAHAAGALVLIDAAQSVPHLPVDVQAIDADFYAFSGHKMLGPTGIGILFAKREHLEAMPPFLGGGDMIKRVRWGEFSTNDVPYKFEAGTPAIAQAIGLGAAVEYLNNIGMDIVAAHEQNLIEYALDRLPEVPGLRLVGPEPEYKGGVAAFEFEGIHAHDVAQILDRYGIAVRAGHHCAMPLHDKLDLKATTRASFYIYNTEAEVDVLVEGLYRVKEAFD